MKKHSMLALLTATVLTSTSVTATTLLDHLDDGAFDPTNWQTSFTNADGWTHSETSSTLTATNISSTVNNSWSIVSLSKNITALSDFDINFGLTWDSEGNGAPIQQVGVRFLDASNATVASVLYNDSWVAGAGAMNATVGESGFSSGFNSLALSGTASINLTRTGSAVDIFWDDSNIFSGVNSSEITTIALEYQFFSGFGSYFGTESIDLDPQVNPVPVPAAVWFFGSALLGLTGLRKKSA